MRPTVVLVAAVVVIAVGGGPVAPLAAGTADARWSEPAAGPTEERPLDEDCDRPKSRPAGPVCMTADDVRVGDEDVNPVGGCVCV